MRTRTSALIALPTALLLALGLSACDEEVATTAPTDSPSSSSAESSAPSKDKDKGKDKDGKDKDKDGKDKDKGKGKESAGASTKPSSKAGASSSSDPNTKNVDINDLKAGDCISEVTTGSQGSQDVVSGTTVVDCSTPHQYEMIGTGTTTAATHAEANTSKEMAKVCSPLLTKYVGSSAADKYSVLAATPVQEAWDQGDRSFVCVAQNADESPLNNSIKNS